MQLRRRDVEQWMSHRRLPEDLRRRVRRAERFTWAATQGVNEEELLSNLPEDIQRDIRRHFFRFLNKVCLYEDSDCSGRASTATSYSITFLLSMLMMHLKFEVADDLPLQFSRKC
jgi:hypothetical protein